MSRSTAFHPQSNAFIERMNRNFQNMLAKCINAKRSNWSQLPYVMRVIAPLYMNPQYTPHNCWCTDKKLRYVWISCSSAQNPNVQLMSMNLSISENNLSSQHFSWSATILTTISDGVTPYIITRYLAPPTETDKKCSYIRQWYRLAETPSFFNPGRGPCTILKCLNDVN